MTIVYAVLALISLPATFLMANLFWQQFRETRGIAVLLGNEEYLRRLITANLFTNPPPEVSRWSQLGVGVDPATMMRGFQQADQQAHEKLRSLLRPAMAISVLGSGAVGWLGLGWFGLALPVINVLLALNRFNRSTQGDIDDSSKQRAKEHVQILAVILHRWLSHNPPEARAWLDSLPRMRALGVVVAGLSR